MPWLNITRGLPRYRGEGYLLKSENGKPETPPLGEGAVNTGARHPLSGSFKLLRGLEPSNSTQARCSPSPASDCVLLETESKPLGLRKSLASGCISSGP